MIILSCKHHYLIIRVNAWTTSSLFLLRSPYDRPWGLGAPLSQFADLVAEVRMELFIIAINKQEITVITNSSIVNNIK